MTNRVFEYPVNRRRFLRSLAPLGAAARWAAAGELVPGGAPRTAMGIGEFSFSRSLHRDSPSAFLEYSNSLGASGVQMGLESLTDDDLERLRRRAEELEMAVEVDLELPKPDDSGEFERDRKSTRLNSSHLVISYAVFCLKKKNNHRTITSSSKPTSSYIYN